MLFGTFFPVGLVAMLLGLGNNFLAINGNVAFLLNTATGTFYQVALPSTVLCATPYEGQVLVLLQNGGASSFALITQQGKVVSLKGEVDGKALSCSAYKELVAVSYLENGKLKVSYYVVNAKKGTVTKSVELPAPSDADEVLLGPTYTAIYGKGGLYVYKGGKPVKVCGKPVVTASAKDDMVAAVLSTNAVMLMEMPSGKKVTTIVPARGTVTDALIVKAAGENSEVLVGLKGTNKGLALYKGSKEVLSIGLQNVLKLSRNGKYVGAIVDDPNLGKGVAAVPAAWFMK